jgi:hypothetical protein
METEKKLRGISFFGGLALLVFFIYNRTHPIYFDYHETEIVFIYFFNFLLRFITAILSYYLSKKLNRNGLLWFLLGFFIPMLTLLILPFFKTKNKEIEIKEKSDIKRNLNDNLDEYHEFQEDATEISDENKNIIEMTNLQEQVSNDSDKKNDFKLMSSENLAIEIVKIFGNNSINELQDSINAYENEKAELLSNKLKDISEKIIQRKRIEEIDNEIDRLKETIVILKNTGKYDYDDKSLRNQNNKKTVEKNSFSGFSWKSLNKGKKFLIILSMIMLVMITMNPTNVRFTEYLESRGFKTSHSRYDDGYPSWGRKNNFIILSIYQYNSEKYRYTRYIGVCNNFILID